MSNEIVPYEQRVGALSIVDMKAQVNLIQHVMREVMQSGQHYGVIPGTGTKPTLLKAGAEKLCLTFRLDPQYETSERYDGNHLTVVSKCTLWHIPSGQRFGSGMGSCSTKESKYAYRTGKRKCPQCGAEAINRSKFPPKSAPQMQPGWYCFSKQGGCGAQFDHDDKAITEQKSGRIPNEDLADQYNTVLKVSNKRSLIAAVLNTTAASDIFTQDIEDIDTERPSGGNPPPAPHSPVGAAGVDAPIETRSEVIERMCRAAYGDADWSLRMTQILDRCGVQSMEETTDADYESAKSMLNRAISKLKKD